MVHYHSLHTLMTYHQDYIQNQVDPDNSSTFSYVHDAQISADNLTKDLNTISK